MSILGDTSFDLVYNLASLEGWANYDGSLGYSEMGNILEFGKFQIDGN